MAITLIIEIPGFTQEQYEKVNEEIMSQGGIPENCSLHVGGPIDGGWQVIEIWESAEVHKDFMQNTLGPTFGKLNISLEPSIRIAPVHSRIK
jgi:hypothetical protein